MLRNDQRTPKLAVAKYAGTGTAIDDGDGLVAKGDLGQVGLEVVVEYQILVLGPFLFLFKEFDSARQWPFPSALVPSY